MADRARTRRSPRRTILALLGWRGLMGKGLRSRCGSLSGIGFLMVLGLVALGGWSCECGDDDCGCLCPDRTAPATPRGLCSITGNDQVTLVWAANSDADLEGYEVSWNTQYEGDYTYLATVLPSGSLFEEYVDHGAVNGETYYYAVRAFDDNGNYSELSPEEVWDTPRPDGTDATIGDALVSPVNAGFDLSRGRRVDADDTSADFHYRYETSTREYFIVTEYLGGSGENVLIQDMGWTEDFDEIDFAPPDEGWSPSGVVEAISGHTYVLLTLEGPSGYYAKIRLTLVRNDSIRFDWACQHDAWNRQLDAP